MRARARDAPFLPRPRRADDTTFSSSPHHHRLPGPFPPPAQGRAAGRNVSDTDEDGRGDGEDA